MNLKERLNISIGSIQIFLGLVFLVVTFIVFNNYYGVGESLGAYENILMIALFFLGIFSIFSGFVLSSK